MMSLDTASGNKHFQDMINLRKKLKKEEENRRLFTEQARKKDEELKRVLAELEAVKDNKEEESENSKKQRVVAMQRKDN